MTLPTAQDMLEAMDATWPAARYLRSGPWMLRAGRGGGQRVSSASACAEIRPGDIETAEAGMRALGQTPLFQIRDGDQGLDAALAERGYALKDPVTLYVMSIGATRDTAADGHVVIPAWPIPAIARRLWAEGGIGAGRLDVMQRAAGPKAVMLARSGHNPAGVGFAAISGGIAMIHAIEVRSDCRRMGVGQSILSAAEAWAQDMGVGWLGLAVTKENFAANALYAKRGMAVVTHYHYRRGQEYQSLEAENWRPPNVR